MEEIKAAIFTMMLVMTQSQDTMNFVLKVTKAVHKIIGVLLIVLKINFQMIVVTTN